MVPKTQRQWTVQAKAGAGFNSLVLDKDAPIPQVGDHDVLVKFHAISLNFRDLLIAQGMYPFGTRDGVVPVSDGAGVVAAIGPRVTRFKVGDRVTTLLHQEHIAGPLSDQARRSATGGMVDGAMREYGAFQEQGLVSIPANLDFREAAALPCAGVTAWNALYGLGGMQLKPGDTLLAEGTGGVSTFAIQFAKAAGARVVATTSSAKKVKLLETLGADTIINYKENPEWGQIARDATPNGEGVSLVVEVGGPKALRQAISAIKREGLISMVGTVSSFVEPDSGKEPTFIETVFSTFTVRGVAVGSRLQLEDMNRAIEFNDIHPVLDDKVFALEDAPEAFEYMWNQRHFGNVIIQIA